MSKSTVTMIKRFKFHWRRIVHVIRDDPGIDSGKGLVPLGLRKNFLTTDHWPMKRAEMDQFSIIYARGRLEGTVS